MGRAYQIVMNGYGHTVTGTLEKAFDHVAASVLQGEPLPPLAEINPMIAASGVDISRFHRIRLEVEQSSGCWESLAVVTHDLDRPAEQVTAIGSYDLADDFDPSYLVTRQLLLAEHSDESLEDLATQLEVAVSSELAHVRPACSDEDLVGRWRSWQADLGGPPVVPPSGDAEAIVRMLPSLARMEFTKLAASAFPDESPSPSPR